MQNLCPRCQQEVKTAAAGQRPFVFAPAWIWSLPEAPEAATRPPSPTLSTSNPPSRPQREHPIFNLRTIGSTLWAIFGVGSYVAFKAQTPRVVALQNYITRRLYERSVKRDQATFNKAKFRKSIAMHTEQY